MDAEPLQDHIIVCAYGRVGRTAARELEAEGHRFIVVDRLETLEPLMKQDGVRYLIGDPTAEHVLRQAGVMKARAMLCAVDSDADNIYMTLTARALNPNLFIVARASEPETRDRLRLAGADRIVSPYASSGEHMAVMALRPNTIDYLDIDGAGGVTFRFEELLVEEGSHLVGGPIGAVVRDAEPVALHRANGDVVVSPGADAIIQAGDLVVTLGRSTR